MRLRNERKFFEQFEMQNQYLGLSTLCAVVTPLEISKTKDNIITKVSKVKKSYTGQYLKTLLNEKK